MSLRDHFHSPWSAEWPWEGVHGAWAAQIAVLLNATVLPEDYHAIPLVKSGGRVEIDVATIQSEDRSLSEDGGVATAVWAPPQPAVTLAVDFPDWEQIEVQVIRRFGGAQLRAAIELVSPSNKDRPRSRRHFALKCAAYLEEGVSVVVVDVVTERLANLHAEVLGVLRQAAEPAWQSPTSLSAVAYRPVLNNGQPALQIWTEALRLGALLPTLPLWLEPDLCVPLRLEESYATVCQSLRIPV